jgi:hypothetical protein
MQVTYLTRKNELREFNTEAPILLVDFDGTCTDGNFFDFWSIDVPVRPGCRKALIDLQEAECTIVLWTCRTGPLLQQALEYLNFHDIPYHFINEEVPWSEYPNEFRGPKVFGTYYIDDRNIGGLPSWREIKDHVLQDPYFKLRRTLIESRVS